MTGFMGWATGNNCTAVAVETKGYYAVERPRTFSNSGAALVEGKNIINASDFRGAVVCTRLPLRIEPVGV